MLKIDYNAPVEGSASQCAITDVHFRCHSKDYRPCLCYNVNKERQVHEFAMKELKDLAITLARYLQEQGINTITSKDYKYQFELFQLGENSHDDL